MFSDINIFAVIAASIVSFAVGAVWHGPLFGKKWMELADFTEQSIKSMPLTPKQAMTFGTISTLIGTYILAYFVVNLNIMGISEALMLGFLIWLGFIATTLANSVLWEGRSAKLYAFNLAYALVNIWVVAIILTVWQ